MALLLCLEGFLYGRTSVLCALTCNLAKEVQLFLGLGIYSGIFAIYLQSPSKESRTATVVFCVLCLLYFLSTASVISDLIAYTIEVSNNSTICENIFFLLVMQTRLSKLPLQVQIDSQSMLISITTVQAVVSGCCDLITQCTLVRINHCIYHPFYSPKSSKIYRCWIVWGKNIRVVIVPSFLAITYIGQSMSSFNKPISIYRFYRL